MSTGRYVMRGRVFQPRVFAGWALANGGVIPATRYGRFVAGEVYQSNTRAGQAYQSGVALASVYQSTIAAGQVQ